MSNKQPKAKNAANKGSNQNISADEAKRRAKQSARDKASRKQGTAQFFMREVQKSKTASPALKQLMETIGALIDPDNHRPFRLPDGGRKTFVAPLRDVQAIADNGADVTVLTPASGFGVARRDPRCALIVTKGGLSGASGSYQHIFPNGTNTSTSQVLAGTPFPASIFKANAANSRHGAFFCPWQFNDGRNRFWFQNIASAPSTITITGLTASTAYTLVLNWVIGKQQTSETITVTSNGSGTAVFDLTALGAARKGYLSLSMQSTLPAGATITYLDNSTTGVCHLAAPDFWTGLPSLDSIRTNSYSLMCSDRTNELVTQGDIVSYQVSGGITWDELIGMVLIGGSLDPYSSVTSQTKLCYKGAYKKGRYIPAKSSADPREAQLIQLGDTSDPWDLPPIIVAEQLNFLYIGYNSHVNPTTGSLIGEWTMASHVEGETESQLFNSQSGTMHPDVLKEAKHFLSDKEYDFENISHLSKIWNVIKGVGKALLPAASAAIPFLPPQFQVPAALGAQFANGLFNMP
jgi:hypothetical protein